MRIGWVLPWLHRVGGNKLALSLAAETARNGHDVEMFAHTVRAEILPEVHRQLGQARLTYLRQTDRPYSVYRDTLSWQLARGREAALARAIGTSHARSPFDVLVLVANEGGRLGHRLHDGLAPPRPLVGRSVMELIDHSFLLRREVDRLPPLFRDVVVLRDLNEMCMADVAEQLGISIVAAKSRLLRARLELKRRTERGAGPPNPRWFRPNDAAFENS